LEHQAGDYGKRFVVRADEKLTAFAELEAAIRKTVLTSCVGGWQSRFRAKSVRRLPPEFHLTLFPQGNRERRFVCTTKEKKIP
jgi:hypothetical protein